MKPLVSILIPAFNAEQWIADTLRSAIAQTWPRTEIIVVDDGSTDKTLAIAKRFESKSIRVVSQMRQGGPAARNTAYSLSQGDYFQWLENDRSFGARQDRAAGGGIGAMPEQVDYSVFGVGRVHVSAPA